MLVANSSYFRKIRRKTPFGIKGEGGSVGGCEKDEKSRRVKGLGNVI